MVAHPPSRIKPSLFIAIFILFFLLSPYILLSSRLAELGTFDFDEFIWALRNSFFQGFLSASFALFLALPLTWGLLKTEKTKSVFEFLLLLPCFLPPLFILLIFLDLLDPFPAGNLGVSFIHGMTLAGLIAVQWSQWLQQQAAGMIETALVFGCSKIRLWILVCKMMKWQGLQSFLFVFAIAFTSFSIPLAVGGGRGTNIEILIYEKIRISGSWGQALALALVQSFFLLAVAQIRPFSQMPKDSTHSVQKLGSYWGLLLCLIYIGIFLSVFTVNSWNGWDQVLQIEGVWEESLRLIPVSVLMAVSVALACIVFLLLVSWASEQIWFRRFMNGYVTASTALIGFSILIFSVYFDYPFISYVIGFLLLSLNSVYRLNVGASVQSLLPQQEIARTLGASSFQVWRFITLPQVLPSSLKLGGVLGFWILGDFALARIVFNYDATLAMHIESLMSSYRIDAALALSAVLVALGVLVYLLFWGLSYVVGRRFN